MKKLLIPLFFLMGILQAIGQSVTPSVIATNGDLFSSGTGSLSWTLGETATQLLNTSTHKLSEGFQQPSYINCNTLPVAPASVSQTLVNNICGGRVYRYTATTTAGAVGYAWTLPMSLGGTSGVLLDSGSLANSQTIRVLYTTNAAAFATDSIWVNAYNTCGAGPKRSAKLTITALTPPAMPASLIITPIQTNICGARIYRYTAPALPAATTTATAATGWDWSLIGPLSASVSLDSGTWSSQVVRLKFSANNAASPGDSIYLKYLSACGNSLPKGAKLTNTLLSPPLAPSSITITPYQTNVCGAKIYRFSAPALPVATATSGAATGWQWGWVGSLGASISIDSGTLTSQIVRLKFSSNAAAVAGDSIQLKYNSGCGYSPNKSLKFTNTLLNTSLPASIVITPVQTNVCGARIYRYTAPALVSATATTAAATGWQWSMVGTLAATAVVDSGSLTSQVMRLRFSSNAAATIGDSILLRYNSLCGYGATKSLKLTNTLLSSPIPASITITPLQTNVCGVRIYRYTAPSLPAATATAPAATGYQWYLPYGPIGTTGVLDSGSYSSRVIRIRYSSNSAAGIGDSIKLAYSSLCGLGVAKAFKLTNTATIAPAAPASITTQLVLNTCGYRVYRYTAPNLPAATTTAVAATGWEWSWIGALGATAVIDSGTVNTQKIRLKFSSNDAAVLGDSMKLRYLTGCTSPSNWKAILFTNLALLGCKSEPMISKANEIHETSGETNVNVYPNPSSDNFNLVVKYAKPSPSLVSAFDMQGRLVYQKKMETSETKPIEFGANWQPGIYMLYFVQSGKTVKRKLIKK